jgi:hypothetical protein
MSRVVLLTVALLAVAGPTLGAEPVRDLGQITLAAESLVYVRTTNGAEITGRLIRASRQALTIRVLDGRELTLMSGEIQFVWRRGDRLRNGAIIGGIIGAAGAIGGQSTCSDCSSEVAAGLLLGVPVWAGIGALIDRAHVGRTLIYRAP